MASATRFTTALPGVTVRPARRGDATHIAVLCDIAGEGIPAAMWRRSAAPNQSAFDYGRTRILSGETSFNLRNSLLAESDGEVAALILGYKQPDPYEIPNLATMPAFILPLIQLKAESAGYWYLNILAVYPEFRRRGIGRVMLSVADELGRTVGGKGLSLIASSENRDALALYRAAGYAVAATRPAVGTPEVQIGGEWWLMTKPLPQ